MAQGNHYTGLFLYRKGDYVQALSYFDRSLAVSQGLEAKGNDSLFYREQESKTLGTMGVLYSDQGNYPLALKYFFMALAIDEKLANDNGITRHLVNIGIIYREQGELKLALEHYVRALQITEKTGNKPLQASTLGNIANVYQSMAINAPEGQEKEKYFSITLEYLTKAMEIDEETGNKRGKGIRLGNIANIYKETGQMEKALLYIQQAIKLFEEIGSRRDLAINHGNTGDLYMRLQKYDLAEQSFKRSLEISYELGIVQLMMEFEKGLSMVYELTGRHSLALEHYKKYISAKDTLFNDERSKEIGRLEASSEFEREKALADAEHRKELELSAEREKRQQVVSYAVAGGLLLVLLFAIFIFNRFRLTQKQKRIIEEQKAIVEAQKGLVEEKQKEILDSIQYAKRIQQSLMPTEKYIHRTLQKFRSR